MKKPSFWLTIASAVLALVGMTGLLLGWLMPGAVQFAEPEGQGGKAMYTETKKKSDALVQQLKETMGSSLLPEDRALDHRVFVSRTLVFLPKDKEPVQALGNDLVTSDGILVSWKIKHGLDLQDPRVAEQDEDSDGFTNKEEFDKGTDPGDPKSSPSKWVKVKIESVETNTLGIGLSGKSSDRYTLRMQAFGKKKDLDVAVGDQLWVAATAKGLEVLKSEAEWNKAKSTNGCPHAIPLKIKGYQVDKGERMDDKTKTKNDYDDSYLEIERCDPLGGVFKILIDERGKSRGVNWPVGDIRLISLVPGEGGMGPFRVGQEFSYAQREFLIRDASPSKVSLWIKAENEEVQILPKTP